MRNPMTFDRGRTDNIEYQITLARMNPGESSFMSNVKGGVLLFNVELAEFCELDLECFEKVSNFEGHFHTG